MAVRELVPITPARSSSALRGLGTDSEEIHSPLQYQEKEPSVPSVISHWKLKARSTYVRSIRYPEKEEAFWTYESRPSDWHWILS